MRYIVTLSYSGSAFSGWQIQPNAPTVQETLEKSLSTLLRENISVVGAGRTDTGVNAIGYAAHFDYPDALPPIDCERLGCKLNAILPKEIIVHDVRQATGDFHARFLATRREYTYFLHRAKDPFVSNYSCLCTFPLDVDAMNRAAGLLLGRHDFSCFEKTGADNKTSICSVTEAAWHPYTPTHVSLMGYKGTGDYLYFRIAADRFLRNMVRAIVGTLIEVGRGKRSIEDFAALILPPGSVSSPGRCAAGESVPGHALFLSKVEY